MQNEPTEKPRVYLSRRKASIWLEAKYGAKVSAATLAKMAVRGNGPPYRLMGRQAVYTPEDLDVWALSRLSALMHSTAARPSDPFRRRGRPRKDAQPRTEA
jgi:hypothetical protein